MEIFMNGCTSLLPDQSADSAAMAHSPEGLTQARDTRTRPYNKGTASIYLLPEPKPAEKGQTSYHLFTSITTEQKSSTSHPPSLQRAGKPAYWYVVLLLLVGICTTGFQSLAQTEKRIYTVGNSVTDGVNFEGFKALAESRGYVHTLGRQMIPGAPLSWLWDHPNDGFIEEPFGYPTHAFPNYTWDAISLQPFDRHIEGEDGDLQMAKNFIDLAKGKSPQVQVYIYSRYPRKKDGLAETAANWNTLWNTAYTGGWDGTNEYKDYYEKLITQLRSHYAGSGLKVPLMIPLGDVMYALNNKMAASEVAGYTNIWEVYSDGIHMNNVGSYIVACTFFATIYQESPVGLPVPAQYGTISNGLRDIIQQTVWEIVTSNSSWTGVSLETVHVTGISLSPATQTLALNQTVQLTPAITPANATNKSVNWSSSDTTVATVSATGMVTGVSAGAATITVTTQDGNHTATATVNVTNNSVAVESISISPDTVVLNINNSQTLTATITPAYATNKNFSWSSTNESVATVSATGVVRGVSEGYATIIATTQDGSKQGFSHIQVTANSKPVAVISATPTAGSAPLAVQFSAGNSTDPNPGDYILGFDWDFGDGSTHANSNAPSHTYSAAGIYTVTLRVMDNHNLYSDPVTTTITVNETDTNATVSLDLSFTDAADADRFNFVFDTGGESVKTVENGVMKLVLNKASWHFYQLMIDPFDFVNNPYVSFRVKVDQATPMRMWIKKGVDTGIEKELYNQTLQASADYQTIQLHFTDLAPLVGDMTELGIDFGGYQGEEGNRFAGTVYLDYFRLGQAAMPGGDTLDTEAPTAPTALQASAITSNSFTLNWTAASDNVAVTAYKVYRDDVLVATTTTTTAQLSGLSAQTAYRIKVSAQDAAGNSSTSQPLTVTTSAPAPLPIAREVWSNLSGEGIASIPLDTPPDSVTQLTSLQTPMNVGDNYGTRIRAYITPAVTGYYTFYITADDVAQLWLSHNEDPEAITQIAQVKKAVKPGKWKKKRGQRSVERLLTAGVKYYVEVLHRETVGKDHVAVGWTGPGIRKVTVIGGSVLSPYGVENPEPTYTLTVNNGGGQGSYKPGSVVTIAAVVPQGHTFSQWTGDVASVANIKAASTTMTMPAANATLSAIFIRADTTEMPKLNVGMDIGSIVYYSKQNAFKNMAKQSSTFLTSYSGGPWDTQEIGNIPADINGYPLELPYNGNVFVHAILPFYYPEGRYVLTYDGEGEVTMNLNATVVSSTPGRIVFDYRQDTNGGLSEYKIVRSTRGNHVKNIVIVPIDMEGEDVKANPFRDDFLEYLKPLQAIRYMGFMHINSGGEMVEWTDRALVDDYTYQSGDYVEEYLRTVKGIAGVPIEVCAQLSNILQQDAWFCVPHAASDDFIKQYARLVKEKIEPNLKTYVEYSNEIWNWAFAFQQSHYIINNAPGHPNAYVSADLAAISPNTDMHPEKDAYMIGRTMRLWAEEWAGELNRLVRVAAVQHGWVDNTRRILEYLKVNNQKVDAVSPAGYFGLNWELRNQLNAKGADLTYQEVVDAVIENFETEEKPNTLAQAAYAKQYGLSYVAYEGGSHVDYRGDDSEKLKQLIKQFDDSQDVYDMYKRNLRLHISPEVNCELFVALTYVSEPGAFGHLEYLGEPLEDAPKYRALLDASPSTYVPSFPSAASSQGRVLYEQKTVEKQAGAYPNPTSNQFSIDLGEAKVVKATLTTMHGSKVNIENQQLNAGRLRVDIASQPPGIYFLMLEVDGKRNTYKIIKE